MEPQGIRQRPGEERGVVPAQYLLERAAHEPLLVAVAIKVTALGVLGEDGGGCLVQHRPEPRLARALDGVALTQVLVHTLGDAGGDEGAQRLRLLGIF